MIVRRTRSHRAEYGELSPADRERLACCARPVRDFAAALRDRTDVAVIAEVKKASPSAGPIAPEREASKQALHYQDGGAAAISVLTEPESFGGSFADLSDVADAVDVPVLRKDFVVDPVQLFVARGHGADAVLLMVSVLGEKIARVRRPSPTTLGLTPLVEVIAARELAIALKAGARVIAVNSRDLHTLAVDRRGAHERCWPRPSQAGCRRGRRQRHEIASGRRGSRGGGRGRRACRRGAHARGVPGGPAGGVDGCRPARTRDGIETASDRSPQGSERQYWERSTTMSDKTRFGLDETRIPEAWYNIIPDLKNPPAPPRWSRPTAPSSGRTRSARSWPRCSRWSASSRRCRPTAASTSPVRSSTSTRRTARRRSCAPRQLERVLGLPAGIKIFYKYEGVSPAGSHKPNTAIPQAYYNKQEGITKISTETGAGQWGSALVDRRCAVTASTSRSSWSRSATTRSRTAAS